MISRGSPSTSTPGIPLATCRRHDLPLRCGAAPGEAIGEVAAALAAALYWRDLWAGGWSTDIGLLRGVYDREAQATLEALGGRLIRIS